MRHRPLAGKLAFLASKASRRRVYVAGLAALGVSGATLVSALPAGASGAVTSGSTANSIIVGSGSSTTYQMMQTLDVIFNDAEISGCPMYESAVGQSSQPQNLDFRCATYSGGTFGPEGGAAAINPYNDAAVEEAPLGSSNGIAQLEDASGAYGSSTITDWTGVNFARSSRDPAGTDDSGLNFVAYAKDGVPWLHFTKVDGTPTPSGKVTSLTQAQLQGIFLGYSGSAPVLTEWNQVQSGKISCVETDSVWNNSLCTGIHQVVPVYAVPTSNTSPIIVVSAQEGSGTQSTFKTFLGKDPSAANGVNCDPGFAEPGSCVGPLVVFENELNQVTPNDDTHGGYWTAGQDSFLDPASGSGLPWSTTQGGGGTLDQNTLYSDMIFFYSYGKWTTQCKHHDCGAISPALSTAEYTEALGFVGGTATHGTSPWTTSNSDEATWTAGIKATEATILGSATCGSSCSSEGNTGDGLFPIDRYLYNVYSNGSNASIPEATAPTLNYVSEVGALCKASDAYNYDPNTSSTYLSEIQASILEWGFFPLSGGATTGTTAYTLVNNVPIDEGDVVNYDGGDLLQNYATAHPGVADVDFLTPGTDSEYTATAWGSGQTNGTYTNASTGDPMGYCLVSTTGT